MASCSSPVLFAGLPVRSSLAAWSALDAAKYAEPTGYGYLGALRPDDDEDSAEEDDPYEYDEATRPRATPATLSSASRSAWPSLAGSRTPRAGASCR